jgi:hypothetical protein
MYPLQFQPLDEKGNPMNLFDAFHDELEKIAKLSSYLRTAVRQNQPVGSYAQGRISLSQLTGRPGASSSLDQTRELLKKRLKRAQARLGPDGMWHQGTNRGQGAREGLPSMDLALYRG